MKDGGEEGRKKKLKKKGGDWCGTNGVISVRCFLPRASGLFSNIAGNI